MVDTLSHALAMAEAGFRIFPLIPNGKRPAVKEWQAAATIDAATIGAWWHENPNYNIGVATGRDVIVVDIDVKNGREGAKSLELLDMIGLPASFRVRTPSGGTHIYLAAEEKFGNHVELKDYPGVDIRAEGGLVVGPGSTIDGKSYEAVSDFKGLAPVPDWFAPSLWTAGTRSTKSETPLIDLDQVKNIERAKEYLLNRAPEAIEGAGGDDTTYRVATRCRDYGLSEGTTLELMLEHWNEAKASPPWMPDNLAAKVANAYQYASGGWGSATAEAEFDVLDIDVGESPIGHKKATVDFTGSLVNAASLAGRPIKERLWNVKRLIPAGTVTLLSGDGATGKSLLALMLATATASGRPWLGREVREGRCLYLSAEDDTDEIHRRLADIQAASFGEIKDLSRLDILDLAGRNALLGKLAPARDSIEPTDLFANILKWARDERPALIVLDTLADIFGGDEIVRVQARQFVGLLKHLAIESGAAVVVLAHPSLSGMASGEGTSGSTAWSNSVRSRLYFERVKEKSTELDANRRILRTKKANYGPVGEEIEMRWRDGVFVTVKVGDADTRAAEQHVERTFVSLLRTYEAEGRAVSDKPSPAYAPKVFERDERAGGIKRIALEKAMNRLFEKRAISVHEDGPPSRRKRKLVANIDVGDEYGEDFGD